jgi:hypothetical protein
MVPITAERLRDLLAYNPETGEFAWRVSRGRARQDAIKVRAAEASRIFGEFAR